MTFDERYKCSKCGKVITIECECQPHYNDDISIYASCDCGGWYNQITAKVAAD